MLSDMCKDAFSDLGHRWLRSLQSIKLCSEYLQNEQSSNHHVEPPVASLLSVRAKLRRACYEILEETPTLHDKRMISLDPDGNRFTLRVLSSQSHRRTLIKRDCHIFASQFLYVIFLFMSSRTKSMKGYACPLVARFKS